MTIRPMYPLLATFLVTVSACDGGTGGEGGGGTGGDGGAGGGGAPACEEHALKLYGCVVAQGLPEAPGSSTPVTLATTATVTAVRVPDPPEPCAPDMHSAYWFGSFSAGNATPEVLIDLVDANGSPLTVGFVVPGFTSSAVAVGDSLDVSYASEFMVWGGRIGHLSLERGGDLVAAVGENEPVGLTVGKGQSECDVEDTMCGREYSAMAVEAPDGSSASLPTDATAEVGELTVTNDHYFRNYSLGGSCNFGLDVEYLVGITPTPTP